MTPNCSPVDPMMTRTSRARIRPFTRYCGCRLNQAPDRRDVSAAHRRVFLSHFGEIFPEALYGVAAARATTTGAQNRAPRGVVSNILCLSKGEFVLFSCKLRATSETCEAAPVGATPTVVRFTLR